TPDRRAGRRVAAPGVPPLYGPGGAVCGTGSAEVAEGSADHTPGRGRGAAASAPGRVRRRALPPARAGGAGAPGGAASGAVFAGDLRADPGRARLAQGGHRARVRARAVGLRSGHAQGASGRAGGGGQLFSLGSAAQPPGAPGGGCTESDGAPALGAARCDGREGSRQVQTLGGTMRSNRFRFSLLGSLTLGLFGCSDDAATAPTYHRDIRPLVEQKCANCHVAGGIAPFALSSYDDVAGHKDRIAVVVPARIMPPWLADPSCAEYYQPRNLSDAQIATFTRWIDAGAPVG